MSLAVHQVLWMSTFFIMNVIVIFDNTNLWPCGILCNKYCTEISRPVLGILELSSFYCTMISDSQWTLTQLHLLPREWHLSANALPFWIGFFGQCQSDDGIWYLFRLLQCYIGYWDTDHPREFQYQPSAHLIMNYHKLQDFSKGQE